MKKRKAALAVGLCLAIGLSGVSMVACGKKDDPTPDYWSSTNWSKPDTTHWLAGKFAKYGEQWNDDGTDDKKAPVEDLRFEQNGDNAAYYRIQINLYKDDIFKIRYEGAGWGSGTNKGAYPAETLNDAQFEEEGAKITGETGSGMGGKNFQVYADGKYEIRVVEKGEGESAEVSYVYLDEAEVLPNPVTKIELNVDEKSIEVGDEFDLTATFTPTDADNKSEIKWSSADSTKVTVSDAGKVKGIALTGADGVKITATCGKVTAECVVKVIENVVPATAVAITNKTAVASMHVGEEVTLTSTVTPNDSTDTVSYTSSASAIAAFDETNKAKLKAVAPGTATVTATAGTQTDTASVTVATDYYVIGQSKNPGVCNWSGTFSQYSQIEEGMRFAVSTSGDSTVYTATNVNLYKDDMFKLVILGTGWADQINATKIATGSAEGIADDGTNDHNMKVTDDSGTNHGGKYTIEITETPVEGEDPTISVKFTRTGDADEAPWTYDLYVKGGWGAGSWAVVDWVRVGDFSFDKEHLSQTGNFTVTGISAEGVEFGFQLSTHGKQDDKGFGKANLCSADSPLDGKIDATGTGNFKIKASGTYNVTVTLASTGSFESITFNSYTAPAAD